MRILGNYQSDQLVTKNPLGDRLPEGKIDSFLLNLGLNLGKTEGKNDSFSLNLSLNLGETEGKIYSCVLSFT